MDKQTDGELMAQLLSLLAEGAAIGAEALVDAPSPLLGGWLTDAATSFSLAAGGSLFFERVQLSPVARSRIEAFLEGYSCWREDDGRATVNMGLSD